jgi:hypothetical protein
MAVNNDLSRAARRLGRVGGNRRWREVTATERSTIMRRVRAARLGATNGAKKYSSLVSDSSNAPGAAESRVSRWDLAP